MSFGLSLSDVRLAFELGFFIYEKAFSKAQGAHIQYFNFGQDIEALAKTLQRLEEIITQADSQRQQRPWQRPDNEYRTALQPVGEAAGNFKKTLEDCQTLLANNTRYGRNAANFVDNVQWSLGAERDVNVLRDRVRFHLIKLGLLLKPFEILLLLEIRGELRNLRWDVAEIRELLVAQISTPIGQEPYNNVRPHARTAVLPEVPFRIASRFSEALSVCPPTSFTDVANLPLQAAADALVYHFSRSTVEYNPGLDFNQRVPKVPQYLNLLKSRWLLAKLEQSSEFISQGPHAFWAGYLAEIRSEVVKEYRRFDSPWTLEAPPEDVMLLLDDSCYSVWVVEPLSPEPAPLAEQGPTEEKILELDLPDPSSTRKCSLTVLKRGPVDFRLVTTVIDKHNKDFRHEKEIVVNTDGSAIVPTYAVLSDQSASPNSILISNYHVHDLNWQLLKSPVDVKLLQQALLGYRVFHSMSDVQWSLNGSDNPGRAGHAYMQLWELKTLKDLSLDNGHFQSTSQNENLQPQSPGEGASIPLGQRRLTTLSGSTMLSGQSMTSRVTGSRGEGTVLLPPNPPGFVLFTMHEGKHAFLHLEFTCDVVVDKRQCNCRNGRRPCSTTVLASKTSKGLRIRRFCTPETSEQGLARWDLALFRYPQHPKFKDLEVLQKVKYLRLDFASPSLNGEFQTEVGLLEWVRDRDLESYNYALAERRQRERRSS
ncbi:MAG: hypothetical protein LQ343_007923 [Gyalolechia ehrenbergii]|nr:MAG: hypothetical protein LQ343_007923 [Gyalolechia ehrenbergii]